MAAVDTPRARKVSVPPPTIASAGGVSTGGAGEGGSASRASALPAPPPIRIGEDAFVPESTVEGWVRSGAARRANGLLTTHDGRRFLLREAVRVLGRRNGDTDPYGFTGRVESIRDFIRRGASVSADALRLGPAVYDVEYGFLVVLTAQ